MSDLGQWESQRSYIDQLRAHDSADPIPAGPGLTPFAWSQCRECGHRCHKREDGLCGKCRLHRNKQQMRTTVWTVCVRCKRRCHRKPDRLCGKCRAHEWYGSPSGRLYHETYRNLHRGKTIS